MNKKGDISITIIIYAAIALIVMVVLWAIFTGRMGSFVNNLKGEEDKAQDKSVDILKSCQLPFDVAECSSITPGSDPKRCDNTDCILQNNKCVYPASLCAGQAQDKCNPPCEWA